MERLLTVGLIIGIPFIIVCILYAICHGQFIRMNHEKELPDAQTLNHMCDKVRAKRKQKAWLSIHSEIIYAAKRGKKHAQICPEDYIYIPYDELKGELENRGYVLEHNSAQWYEEELIINVSWED